MNRSRLGYLAGQSDALAFRIDRPEKYRPGPFLDGYVSGYQDHPPLQVMSIFLHRTNGHKECFFSVLAAFQGEEACTSTVFVQGNDLRVSEACLVNHSKEKRVLLCEWVRRFWLSHTVDFRGLVLGTVREPHPRMGVRNGFQDYLEETGHPLAGFLRHAWRNGAWPLLPLTLAFPDAAADYRPATPGQPGGFRHWAASDASQLSVTLYAAACGHSWPRRPSGRSQFSKLVDDTAVPCCPVCYRMQPLPDAVPLSWSKP